MDIGVFVHHVPFVMLVTALLLGAVTGLAARNRFVMITAMLRYLMLLAIGAGCLWEFVLQAFFPGIAADVLGLVSSPLQLEISFANLGLAGAGIWAFWHGFDCWVTAAIMATCFSAGTAINFLWQIAFYHAPITGHLFYADILAVLIIDILLYYFYRYCRLSKTTC